MSIVLRLQCELKSPAALIVKSYTTTVIQPADDIINGHTKAGFLYGNGKEIGLKCEFVTVLLPLISHPRTPINQLL